MMAHRFAIDGVALGLWRNIQVRPLKGGGLLWHWECCTQQGIGVQWLRTLNTRSRNSCMAAGSVKLPNLGRAML